MEQLPFDIQLSEEYSIHYRFPVDDIAEYRVSDARGMDSDLMHFSGFYFYLDERDFAQDRMIHRLFIPTFRDRFFSESFIHDGLSSSGFFVELFFQWLIYNEMRREFPHHDSIIKFGYFPFSDDLIDILQGRHRFGPDQNPGCVLI